MKKDLIDSVIKALIAWLVFSTYIFLSQYFPFLSLGSISIQSASDTSNLLWLLVPVLLVGLSFLFAGWLEATQHHMQYAWELVGELVDLLGSAAAAIWAALFFAGLSQLPLAIVFLALSVALYFVSKQLQA